MMMNKTMTMMMMMQIRKPQNGNLKRNLATGPQDEKIEKEKEEKIEKEKEEKIEKEKEEEWIRVDPGKVSASERYRLMTGSIAPRAIGWISTVDREGRRNLAPYSYFTGVSSSPALVAFCPTLRERDGARKDTFI